MTKQKIKITEVVLRDGQQSLIASRMKTKDMIPVLSLLDKVGYSSLEVWGGATYDCCRSSITNNICSIYSCISVSNNLVK